MKTEGIGNKVVLITLLCSLLGFYLILKPSLFPKTAPPSFIDRMPDGDLIGKCSIFNLLKDAYPALHKNQVPFKDYLSQGFVLDQVKSFGIDIQKPSYFFSNHIQGEWGVLLSVSDSSKIKEGIIRLQQFIDVKDTLISKKQGFLIPKQKIFFFFEKEYIFFYHGSRSKAIFKYVNNAKSGEGSQHWLDFSKLKQFGKEDLIIYNQSKRLKELGVEYALLTQQIDSNDVILNTEIVSSLALGIKLGDSAFTYQESMNATKSLYTSIDAKEFVSRRKHPLYKYIAGKAKSIAFPLDKFFAAWNGVLSFHEGGTQLVNEEVVEMSYDEEFNPIEVRKSRLVPVPGYSCFIGVNDKASDLVNALFSKGIITKQGKNYHFLVSPPLSLNILKDNISVYTGSLKPKLIQYKKNAGHWKYKGVRYDFEVDSLTKRSIYGKVRFAFKKIPNVLRLRES